MAPSATLQAVKYVLLLPELLDEAIDEPLYVREGHSANGVRRIPVRPRKRARAQVEIATEQTIAWAESEEEVESNSSPLIPAPVVITNDNYFIHGQVAECYGDEVLVNTAEGGHRVARASLVRTTPIAAVLLRQLSFAAAD
ncbi:hypothetical protein PHYSODRAFT_294665 [Phytophthora sojae]|uniref:Uncharacterized protein n=1 Tax=Phytophthora sojae (strain P6497) TaxID=1094619 RepID=G4YQ61_PHYSP|nr:hypothetical protein PHYSODRAFT_294665 [Phytophthora sojae]EGZ29565.1 hypothetical protein PHYSODRAFT_294665 [Phytophthora sojae]|eukprot:XP_009516840.1 hypothetical protein PHYSODRAFT_294665 [Phytophthora sojae]